MARGPLVYLVTARIVERSGSGDVLKERRVDSLSEAVRQAGEFVSRPGLGLPEARVIALPAARLVARLTHLACSGGAA